MKISKQTILRTTLAGTCVGAFALAFFHFLAFPDLEDLAVPSGTPTWHKDSATSSSSASLGVASLSNEALPTMEQSAFSNKDTDLLNDKSAPLAERIRAALRLAKENPANARDTLLAIVENTEEDARLRAAAARGLAQLDDHQSRALAEKLAQGKDANLARGAVRGLAERDDTGSTRFLTKLLTDKTSSEAVRMEAALGLAQMKSPEAYNALLNATYADLDSHSSEPVFHDVLRGLVRNHYNRSEGIVDELLNHPEIGNETKVVAIDEMAKVQGSEALAALLLQASSENPEIREAAAWAIAGHEEVSLTRDYLLALVEQEPYPWVRSGLYEALRHQESFDLTNIWDRVDQEENVSARIAGIKLIADQMPADASERFSTQFVPQLEEIVTKDPSLTNRLDAIIALSRARTNPEAEKFLQKIQTSDLYDTETKRAAKLALR